MDETEQALLVGKAMMILGLFTVAVALVGEHLGWWNDLGEMLGVLGVIGTGIGLAITVLTSATRKQVTRVGDKVEQVGAKVDQVGTKVEQVGGKVEQVGAKVDQVGTKVEQVGAKVDQVGSKVDRTNSHLDHQTRVLEEIRDLLRRDRAPA